MPLSFYGEYLCPAPPDEALAVLAQNGRERRVPFQTKTYAPAGHRLFEGVIKGNAFSVNRVLQKDFFTAIADGTIEAEGSGSRVRVRCHLRKRAAVVVCAYIVLTIYVFVSCAAGMVQDAAKGDTHIWGYLIQPGCLLVAGLWLCVLPHLRERRIVLNWLQDVLGLESVVPYDSSRHAI